MSLIALTALVRFRMPIFGSAKESRVDFVRA